MIRKIYSGSVDYNSVGSCSVGGKGKRWGDRRGGCPVTPPEGAAAPTSPMVGGMHQPM